MALVLTASQRNALDQSNPLVAASGYSLSQMITDLQATVQSFPFGSQSLAYDVDGVCLGGGAFSYQASSPLTLYFTYGPGRIQLGTSIVFVAGATILLGASVTTYIEVDPIAGIVYSNTGGWTEGRLPLYTVVTGVSAITAVTMAKAFLFAVGNATITGAKIAAGTVAGSNLTTAAATKTLEVNLGAVSATTTVNLICPATAATVTGVSLVNSIAAATNATSNWAFTLIDAGPTGTNTQSVLAAGAINSTGTGGFGFASCVATGLTLNATASNRATLANDCLSFTLQATGTPTALANATLKVDFTFST